MAKVIEFSIPLNEDRNTSEVKDSAENSEDNVWVILAIINIVAMIYPVAQYVRADTNDTQLFAAIVLLGTVFLLAIADAVSAIAVCMV